MSGYPIPDDKRVLFPMPAFIAGQAWQTGVPTHSERVTAFSVDRRGAYQLPFKVRFRDGAWRHGATGDVLRCEVKGWR